MLRLWASFVGVVTVWMLGELFGEALQSMKGGGALVFLSIFLLFLGLQAAGLYLVFSPSLRFLRSDNARNACRLDRK